MFSMLRFGTAALLLAACFFLVVSSGMPPGEALAASGGEKGRPAAEPSSPREGRPAGSDSPTTTHRSGLKLTRNILTVRLEKGFYEVMELLEFQNQGKATIVSKDGAPTLRIVLPRSDNVRDPSARVTAAPHGLDPKFLRQLGNQIVTTEPIPPGRKLVVVLYRLADEYGGVMVEKPIVYGTENFALLPEKGRVQMGMAQELSRLEPVTFRDREYNRFMGATRPGSVLRWHMQAPASRGGLFLFYATGGGVFAVGAALALWMRRRRKKAFSLRLEREELLLAIAALDDRLAGGEISPEEHRRERAPRFVRLRELSR